MTPIEEFDKPMDKLYNTHGWHAHVEDESKYLGSNNPSRHFAERYWAAMIVTACLFGISYYLLNHVLDEQATYVSQIEHIGYQNMLSQEIAKQTLMLKTCEDEYCQRQLNNLVLKLKSFERTQRIILRRDFKIRGERVITDQLDSLISDSRIYHTKITKFAQGILKIKRDEIEDLKKFRTSPKTSQLNISVQAILRTEGAFSRKLSKMATLYKKEAEIHIERIKRYQLFVVLVALLVLSLEALFLFPPILKKIRIYFNDLQAAHQETNQKNKEISEAYQQLQVVEQVTRLNMESLKKTNRDLLMTQEKLTHTHLELSKKNQELKETHDIRNVNKQLEAARFFDSSLNHFSEVMRWRSNQNINSWSEYLLAELVPYVKGMQAIIYVYDADKDTLLLTGSYAADPKIMMDKIEIELGDSLVGQAAKSLQPIYISNPNGQAEVFETQSGTSFIQPQALFVLPLTYNNHISGVLEMTSSESLEDRYIELLKRLSEAIGANLSALQDQKRINQLFADSQLAQKQLRKSLITIQENEERFRKLSEVTQEGIVFLDGNLIKDVNSVLAKMMGYESSKELIHKHYIDLIAPKYRFEIENRGGILEDSLAHETVAIKTNGESFPIEIQSRKVTYEQEVVTVLSIRDITEKKRTQAQLEEANRIARLVTELEKKNKDITSSIEYAQRIQEAILPSDQLMGKGFLQQFVLYIPKDIVSGDFYWFAEKNEHALIAAVDCTGHGVPGAFMSIIGYSNLNKIVIEQGITEPAKILNQLDKEVTEALRQGEDQSRSRDGMDLALCSLNIYEKKLRFAGAYRPLYLIREGQLNEFKGNSFPIGGNFKYKKDKVFTSHELTLQEGDTLYLFSDGFPDQFGGPDNRKYMTKKFKKLLLSLQQDDLPTQKEKLHNEFHAWKKDYKQMDDILIIGLRF